MTEPFHAQDVVERLRARGHLGGTIAQHRAIWRQSLPLGRVLESVALALAFTGALLWLRPWIGQAWGAELLWWIRALEMPGYFAAGDPAQAGLFGLVVPIVAPEMPAPDAWSPMKHAAVLALLWWCTGWVSDAAKPIAFFIRLGVLVHAASVLFFMFWSGSFTHTMSGHVASGLRQTWYLMLATPSIHLLTYYLFPFAGWQRALITAATLAYLFVLTPLQYALHLALAYQAGLILLPLLNLMFGVMLPVVSVVALYGWGMGWRKRGEEARDAR